MILVLRILPSLVGADGGSGAETSSHLILLLPHLSLCAITMMTVRPRR